MQTSPSGKVYLVGAGPGDPGLITVKGVECLQQADVVIYDYLASERLLAHVAPNARTIYVGKKGGDHTLPQQEINTLILREAQAGNRVVRLKGGDPYIFGRGGEEAELLIENGISVEIVPGVTSAIAAAAYAGIPLTHRDYTSTLAFVTGHEDPTKTESSIDWGALARGIGTIVFFMGVKNLPNITRNLIDRGKPASTPVAVIRWGTTNRQQTVCGTLETIVDIVAEAGIGAPAIIVVGEVVRLREKLRWFEKRPLLGKTVLVTRTREQAGVLVKRLSDLGADCIEVPVIEIHPPENLQPLDDAIDAIASYEWVIFTSVNGVSAFFDRLFERGGDVRRLGHIHTAVIGPATAERLRGYGITSDIVPESFRAESIVDAFRDRAISGKRILVPRAKEARPILIDALQKLGAVVDDVPAYRTLASIEGRQRIVEALQERRIDIVTFTSSSTVRNFVNLLPPSEIRELLDGVMLASIGPITTETAEALGLQISVTAETFTIDGLCAAIVQAVQTCGNGRSAP
uniref:uroporphyrinogen-III C-methyltransferase n=1 Tax=Desulfatirhabdium butyrativorans TaxID=340467 RepID=A0A7C4RQT1_9BACT